ncbi:hypothetical protein FA10DRAFT_288654 [Acaromyces ingoldii]|uniref:Uncharacterized protein n=1 Tax=Acaromyces ingoldii TaxID=215250 RepID=A0A316YFQ8_9BASI|nr:hypothetical protein FA10DRAFT_288654 [Acaromyces ingoldii]PWN87961.1 hypothetical protein FA10DRAFT_288654 [Acaromyces ingoldii]
MSSQSQSQASTTPLTAAMALIMETPASVREEMWHQQLSFYVTLAFYVPALFDFCNTLPREISEIYIPEMWIAVKKRKLPSVAIVGLVVTRLITVPTIVSTLAYQTQPSSCQASLRMALVGVGIASSCCEAIFIARTLAIQNKSKILRILLWLNWLGITVSYFASNASITVDQLPAPPANNPYLGTCHHLAHISRWIPLPSLWMAALDLFVFCITVYHGITLHLYHLDPSRVSRITKLLYRDAGIFFIFSFLAHIVEAVWLITHADDTAYMGLIYPLHAFAPLVLGPRVVVNLRLLVVRIEGRDSEKYELPVRGRSFSNASTIVAELEPASQAPGAPILPLNYRAHDTQQQQQQQHRKASSQYPPSSSQAGRSAAGSRSSKSPRPRRPASTMSRTSTIDSCLSQDDNDAMEELSGADATVSPLLSSQSPSPSPRSNTPSASSTAAPQNTRRTAVKNAPHIPPTLTPPSTLLPVESGDQSHDASTLSVRSHASKRSRPSDTGSYDAADQEHRGSQDQGAETESTFQPLVPPPPQWTISSSHYFTPPPQWTVSHDV